MFLFSKSPRHSQKHFIIDFVTQTANPWILDFPTSYLEKPTWKIKGRGDIISEPLLIPWRPHVECYRLTSSGIRTFWEHVWRCTRAWVAISQRDVYLLMFFPLCSHRAGVMNRARSRRALQKRNTSWPLQTTGTESGSVFQGRFISTGWPASSASNFNDEYDELWSVLSRGHSALTLEIKCSSRRVRITSWSCLQV